MPFPNVNQGWAGRALSPQSVSFTAPGQPQAPPQPIGTNRSEILAYMLQQPRGPAPLSAGQAIVEGLGKGLEGWAVGNAKDKEARQKSERGRMMADFLLGDKVAADDPRRATMATMLAEGWDLGPFGGVAMDRLGFGTPQAPIKVGKDESLLDPNTYEPLYQPPPGTDDLKPQVVEIQDPNGPPGATIKVWSYPDGRMVPVGQAPGEAPPERPWWAPEGGGVDPAYIEGQRAGATNITNTIGPDGIDYGEPEKGTVFARDDDGNIILEPDPNNPQYLRPVQVPIGGGSVERERLAGEAAANVRGSQKKRTADVVVDSVDRALDSIEKNPAGTTGWGGAFLQYLPGAEAQSVQQRLLTIKANIGFDRLQLMRESSPTGGAVGQVSNFENQLLQATFGALEQSQNSDELGYNLRRIGALYSVVTGDSEQTQALAQIGQAVDRGEMTPEQAGQMVEGILSTVPDSGWTALPGGVRMREIK